MEGDSLGDSETDGTSEIDGLEEGILLGRADKLGCELGFDDGVVLGDSLETTEGRLLGCDDGDSDG